MARNPENSERSLKKQRVGTSKKRITVRQSKERAKRLVRRHSSGLLSREGQHRSAPTFRQPRPDSQSAGHHAGSSTAHGTGYLDNENEGEDDAEAYMEIDGEDDGDGDEDVVTRLQNGPKDQRYKAIGKLFALKVWPWPSSNWWVGDEGEITMSRNVTRTSNPVREKLTAAKNKLEAMMKKDFTVFLGIDMAMSEDEWMTTKFKGQVSALYLSPTPILITIC